jgi:hypothetical protein
VCCCLKWFALIFFRNSCCWASSAIPVSNEVKHRAWMFIDELLLFMMLFKSTFWKKIGEILCRKVQVEFQYHKLKYFHPKCTNFDVCWIVAARPIFPPSSFRLTQRLQLSRIFIA